MNFSILVMPPRSRVTSSRCGLQVGVRAGRHAFAYCRGCEHDAGRFAREPRHLGGLVPVACSTCGEPTGAMGRLMDGGVVHIDPASDSLINAHKATHLEGANHG